MVRIVTASRQPFKRILILLRFLISICFYLYLQLLQHGVVKSTATYNLSFQSLKMRLFNSHFTSLATALRQLGFFHRRSTSYCS